MAIKPSGTSGPIKISFSNNDGISQTHEKFIWATNKEGIENQIFQFFVREIKKTGEEITSYEAGGTKDLDFAVTSNNQKFCLELMEAFVSQRDCQPFQGGAQIHNSSTYADKVFAGIDKKTKKYGLKHEVPIDLLLYATHEQYNPSSSALELLKHYLIEQKHSFRRVFFIQPLAEDFSILHKLFDQKIQVALKFRDTLTDKEWFSFPSSDFNLVTSPAPTQDGVCNSALRVMSNKTNV